jgi:hypothetical protein
VLRPQVAELKGLLKRADAVGKTRNTIMHALTRFPDPLPQPPVPRVLMTVSQAEELVKDTVDVTRDIRRFMRRHCRDEESWEPMAGRGTLWEVTVKKALAKFTKGPH